MVKGLADILQLLAYTSLGFVWISVFDCRGVWIFENIFFIIQIWTFLTKTSLSLFGWSLYCPKIFVYVLLQSWQLWQSWHLSKTGLVLSQNSHLPNRSFHNMAFLKICILIFRFHLWVFYSLDHYSQPFRVCRAAWGQCSDLYAIIGF